MNQVKTLLWAEWRKLRRSKIIWISVFAVALVSATVIAQGQFVYYGETYASRPGWLLTTAQSLATFYVLPAILALVGSYLICREDLEGTIVPLRLVPIDEKRLVSVKMVVAFIFSLILYLLLFLFMLAAEAVLHVRDLAAATVISFLKMYLIDGAGVFFAISPIIVAVARDRRKYWPALLFAEIYSFVAVFAEFAGLSDVHPITAALNLSGSFGESATVSLIRSALVLFCCGGLTLFMLTRLDYGAERAK